MLPTCWPLALSYEPAAGFSEADRSAVRAGQTFSPAGGIILRPLRTKREKHGFSFFRVGAAHWKANGNSLSTVLLALTFCMYIASVAVLEEVTLTTHTFVFPL